MSISISMSMSTSMSIGMSMSIGTSSYFLQSALASSHKNFTISRCPLLHAQ